MLDGIPLDVNLPATALLSITVLMVLLGKLIPERQARKWERAWELSEQARREDAKQTDRLVEAIDMQTKLLESLRAAAERKSP